MEEAALPGEAGGPGEAEGGGRVMDGDVVVAVECNNAKSHMAISKTMVKFCSRY